MELTQFNHIVNYLMDKEYPIIIITGTTRSGKTYFVNNYLIPLIKILHREYSLVDGCKPEQIDLILDQFRKSNLSKYNIFIFCTQNKDISPKIKYAYLTIDMVDFYNFDLDKMKAGLRRVKNDERK